MGVQTLKKALFVATAVVATVILFQGAAPAVTVVQSRATVDIVDGSAATSSSLDALSELLHGKATPAATTTSSAPTAATTSASTTTAQAKATSVSSTAASATVAGRTYTTTPATVNAPTPTPTPTCPSAIGGSTAGAPGASDASGIPGTSSADLASFASQYNAIRVANCLTPVPFANIRYSSCLQQRVWWIADDPSTDPLSAWGHTGTAVRSDGVPIVGCDGDLAGGTGYTGASVATAWWNSADHRASLYQPPFAGSLAHVCIAFAISHGGVSVPGPNEPSSFTRAAAYWYGC